VIRLNAIGLTAFASGIGQRALSELITSAKKTKRSVAEGVQADDTVVQFGIGELDGRMRAARSHLMGLVSALDERAVEGRATSVEAGLEMSLACQILARASRDMVVFAFDYASTSVVYAPTPATMPARHIYGPQACRFHAGIPELVRQDAAWDAVCQEPALNARSAVRLSGTTRKFSRYRRYNGPAK
jgi:alkylation response protein AidB-like acyl-CoA dehydrogenase